MSLRSHPRPAAGELSTLRRDPWFGVLAILALLQGAFLSAHLVYPDLNLDYPFMDGDSWDWIANGLRLAGQDVRFSGRPPLLPLTIAFLERLSLLPWLPVLLQVLFLGTVLAFYELASRLFRRAAAFAAALALMLNPSLLGTSLQVMADVPASCLLFLASRSFLLARDDPGRYPWAGLAGGLSAVTQPAAWLVTVPAALTVVLRRHAHLRSRQLWLGAAAFTLLPALWLVAEPSVDVPVRHWGLLALHAGSVPFYARAFLSFLGWPGLILFLFGLGLALREARRDATLFIAATFAVLTGFFVFLYAFEAERFLVYPVWMAGLLITGALARLPRPAFVVAAVLLIAGSALPAGLHARVRDAWAARHASTQIDPALVRQDRSALYLYQQPSDGGGRYRVITRLGNALRKRVKYVPAAWFEPWSLRLVPLGRIGTDIVYRVHLPEIRETWLFVAPGIPARTGEDGWDGEGLRQARLINSHLGGWDGYVALVPGEGPPQPWQLYLPFLVETTELYVPEPGQEQEVLEIFAAAPNLGERRIGPVVVRRTELLGRRATLISGVVRGTAAPRR